MAKPTLSGEQHIFEAELQKMIFKIILTKSLMRDNNQI